MAGVNVYDRDDVDVQCYGCKKPAVTRWVDVVDYWLPVSVVDTPSITVLHWRSAPTRCNRGFDTTTAPSPLTSLHQRQKLNDWSDKEKHNTAAVFLLFFFFFLNWEEADIISTHFCCVVLNFLYFWGLYAILVFLTLSFLSYAPSTFWTLFFITKSHWCLFQVYFYHVETIDIYFVVSIELSDFTSLLLSTFLSCCPTRFVWVSCTRALNVGMNTTGRKLNVRVWNQHENVWTCAAGHPVWPALYVHCIMSERVQQSIQFGRHCMCTASHWRVSAWACLRFHDQTSLRACLWLIHGCQLGTVRHGPIPLVSTTAWIVCVSPFGKWNRHEWGVERARLGRTGLGERVYRPARGNMAVMGFAAKSHFSCLSPTTTCTPGLLCNLFLSRQARANGFSSQ
jgi:hypothetical protein